SRRRHTRFSRDWSSDVCSSDLPVPDKVADIELRLLLEALYQRYHYDFRSYARSSLRRRLRVAMDRFECRSLSQLQHRVLHESARSEDRRVGYQSFTRGYAWRRA